MTSQDPQSPQHPNFLIQSAGAWTYAWTGVRIEAAADLTEAEEYSGLSESARLDKTAAADRAWTGGLWEHAHLERYDTRYASDPATGRIACTVLARVAARGLEAALQAAAAVRRQLALTMPRHVHAAELASAAEVSAALVPFRPPMRGIAEIRKRIWSGVPQRPDAGVSYYYMVQPFTVTPASWEPVLRALAAQSAPVMLSVGLIPAQTGPDVVNALNQLATSYHRLGSPGEIPEGIFTSRIALTADAFAVDAHRVFIDAARRYAGRVFKMRITVASPEPIADGLCELIGRAVSPTTTSASSTGALGGVLVQSFSGPAYRIVRPQDAQELASAWHNVAAIEQLRWDRDYYGDQPGTLQPLLRSLCELVDPGEASAAVRLPAAISGALPGFPVRRPAATGLIEYGFDDGQVSLGEQSDQGRPAGRLGISVDDLTRHALFVGAPGSGKTNSTLAFCEQLWRDHRVPFLVVEPVNSDLDDYRWLATRRGFEDLLVLTVGDERVAPLRLNPFEAPPGVTVQAHMGGLKSCFDAAFGLWDPLPAIYDRALLAVYRRRGIVPSERSSERYAGRWPRLAEFSDCLAEEVAKLGYRGDVRANIEAAAQLRAQSLAYGACAGTLDCATSFPVAALLDRPVVVELAALGDNEREQTLVTALLLSALTEYYKANREPASGTRHVMVIEEAHRLLGRPSAAAGGKEGDAQAAAATRFANTLAENRKYGEGVVIVEQVPGKLIEDAYKNSNLKVMHRLPADDDRATIGGTMRFNADQERQAAALAPFAGYVYHDRMDRPVLVQVPDVRGAAARAAGLPRAPLADADELRDRFERFVKDVPEADAALATFPECTGCQHRCFFRGNAEPAATEAAASELDRRVTRFRELPKASRAGWWTETFEWLSDTAANTAPASLPEVLEEGSERLADYEACVVIHLGRRLGWKHTAAWAQQVRQRWPEWARARRAAARAAAAGEAEPDFSDE